MSPVPIKPVPGAAFRSRHLTAMALVLASAVLPLQAPAQTLAQGPAADPVNVLQLSATGQVEVAQDWLTMTLSITREGTDASAVQTQVRQGLEAALQLAKNSARTEAMEVQTGGFSLQPRYGKEGKINGWVGTAELILQGRDFGRIGSTAGEVQALTVSSVQFSLSREAREQVEGRAQAMAQERFKARALELAKGFGFGAYSLREVSVGTSDPGGPRPRMMASASRSMDAAFSAVPLEAGRSLVQVTITGTVQLK